MVNRFLNEKVAVLVKNRDEAEKVKELAYENGFKWAYGVREFNPYGFEFLGEFVYMVPEDSGLRMVNLWRVKIYLKKL